MKKLITAIIFIVLTSCGSSLEPPKSNIDYKNIIGKPVELTKLFKSGNLEVEKLVVAAALSEFIESNLEVAQYDFPIEMMWDDAQKACEALGDGWRLPTQFELNILYKNKVKIGGFIDGWYCTSGIMDLKARGVWVHLLNFNDGKLDFYNKNEVQSHVRAVRALKK